ncbi:GNAT family N-acetyltransferase [Streptomyces lushanensis]|uniref:GNAT family N-acetyltransferase n=1 Tax=Streptomyces lushanensis TaxID=1434255 RepID=UPI00082F1A46|nr:GNAT family N-acetyltransferase [Streptomyces lushanensis]
MRIRDARPDEARKLSGLVLRSKAHWGYDDAFLAACRAELTLSATDMTERRIVVAEDEESGAALGVASLEGEAPDGTLGLLFVEPRAIGLGVGRTLYAHVLDAARDEGFARLTIDSDPHAVGFYRALGARPVPGGAEPLSRLRVDLPPRASWVRAWTGGRRTVQLGNVAEFQAQFAAPSRPSGADRPSEGSRRPEDSSRAEAARRAGVHYSCLAALGSPYPAAVVLPGTVPKGWLELLCRRLAWESVELYDGLGTGPAGLTAEILDRPALVRHLRGLGLPFVPWGRTGATGELSGEPLPPGALRYESKRAANVLFHRLAAAHPGIAVPDQWPVASRRAAARLIVARARSGAGSVVKSEHGVGGSGTHVVTSLRRLPQVLRALPPGPLLVEEFLSADGPAAASTPRDLTYDGLVDAAGAVHDVGAARMDVAGTAYRGATVGPGAVPDGAAAVALRFGHDVGLRLAASGYRGWYDVDFVTAPADRSVPADGPGPPRLAPTEINLRLTGPSVAFMVKARLDETRGGDHLVRSLDHVPLGARLPDGELVAWLTALTADCARTGAVLVPSIPTAAFDPAPFIGVLLAARTDRCLDAAETLVRTAGADLGRLFTPGRSLPAGPRPVPRSCRPTGP